MKQFILLFFISLCFSSFSQTAVNNNDDGKFIFIVDLGPSFHSDVTIEIRTLNRRQIKIKTTRMEAHDGFMVNDSLALDDADVLLFDNALQDISLGTVKTIKSAGMDGMGVACAYYTDQGINRFEFWSPTQNTKAFQIIDAVIRLLERKFTAEKYSGYFKILRKYYDVPTHLELTGTIQVPGRSNFEISDCIANSDLIMGVTAYTASENDALESSFVTGTYSYPYYVDNYDTEAGWISFKYLYTIKDGVLTYRFYELNHDATDTVFQSIGALPHYYNNHVESIFTKEQYSEILKDLYVNLLNATRIIEKYCLN